MKNERKPKHWQWELAFWTWALGRAGIHTLAKDKPAKLHQRMQEAGTMQYTTRQQPYQAWNEGNDKWEPGGDLPGMRAQNHGRIGKTRLENHAQQQKRWRT